MNNIVIPYSGKNNFSNVNGIIIAIEGFSQNFNYYVKESKLKNEIDKIKDIKIYIMLNKVYFDNQIEDVKKLLKKINKLNIEAVIFSDIAIFNIVKENKLNINLIWHNKLVTNSKSINFLEKRGLYGYITTPEITLDEFIKIRKNTTSQAFIKLFGYTNMATSSRSLISNYFKYTKMNYDPSKKYYMYEKINKEFYPIVETDVTNFFSSKILNGIMEYKKLLNKNVDCIVYLDDFMISENAFSNILESFISLKKYPNDRKFALKLEKIIDSNLFNNTDTGFLNKKTIVKVKKDE